MTTNTYQLSRPYQIAEDAMPVGYLTISEPTQYRMSHECAAWFHQYEIAPGVYPVYSRGRGQYGAPWLAVTVRAQVVGGCLIPMFGGVPIGSDDPIEREIGRIEDLERSSDFYAFQNDVAVPFSRFGTYESVELTEAA